MSPKHLQQYINELFGHHTVLDAGTIYQIGALISGMDGKFWTYKDLIADYALWSHTRWSTLKSSVARRLQFRVSVCVVGSVALEVELVLAASASSVASDCNSHLCFFRHLEC